MKNLTIFLLSMLGLSGCIDSVDTAIWTEEVKLDDGSIVIVSRKASAHSIGFPNAQRGSDISWEFSYVPMGIYMQSFKKATFVRDPISFDIINGVPHLVLFVGDREYCNAKNPNDFTAQFFQWKAGQWLELSQENFPITQMRMNLYLDYWGRSAKQDAAGLISWQKKTRNGEVNPRTIQAEFETRKLTCENRLKI